MMMIIIIIIIIISVIIIIMIKIIILIIKRLTGTIVKGMLGMLSLHPSATDLVKPDLVRFFPLPGKILTYLGPGEFFYFTCPVFVLPGVLFNSPVESQYNIYRIYMYKYIENKKNIRTSPLCKLRTAGVPTNLIPRAFPFYFCGKFPGNEVGFPGNDRKPNLVPRAIRGVTDTAVHARREDGG